MAFNSDPQQETNRLLSELISYVRASSAAALRDLATRVITTYAKAIAYQNLSGARSQSDVSKLASVSQNAVSFKR